MKEEESVWRALFRTCKCVRGGSRPFSPLCLARGAGGGQERSRTRKRMQVYRVGVALARMWSGLATINISHRVESSECVRSQSWTSNTFSISRSRIHASVSVCWSAWLTRSLTLHLYICEWTSCIALSANVCSSAGTQSVTFTKINYVRYGICLSASAMPAWSYSTANDSSWSESQPGRGKRLAEKFSHFAVSGLN
jgi:hypothetical protein